VTLRVALVLRRFDPRAGGLERWTWQFAEHLIGLGHEVHVAATAFPHPGLPVVEHLLPDEASPWHQGERTQAIVRGLPCDIVHDAECGWAADVFHPHAGSRVLNLRRDLAAFDPARRLRIELSPRFRRWRRDLRRAEARQMASARAIVAVSRSVAEAIERDYPATRGRVFAVPNGIDTRVFAPAVRAGLRDMARRALGLGDDIVVFLMVAQNFRLKGLDTALAAFARLGASARLLVAGDGPIEHYRRRLAGMPITDRVMFLGLVERMPELYAAADILLHPTFHDACSLATLEALACGLPVITTRVNGAADDMTDGREGFVLPRAGDPAALAAAMHALLDAERRRACGGAAARLGQSRDFAVNCAGILALYDRVLEAGRAQ